MNAVDEAAKWLTCDFSALDVIAKCTIADQQTELTELREIAGELAETYEPPKTHFVYNSARTEPNPVHGLWLRSRRWKRNTKTKDASNA